MRLLSLLSSAPRAKANTEIVLINEITSALCHSRDNEMSVLKMTRMGVSDDRGKSKDCDGLQK